MDKDEKSSLINKAVKEAELRGVFIGAFVGGLVVLSLYSLFGLRMAILLLVLPIIWWLRVLLLK